MIQMSESKRAALALLSEVWALSPDMRLGQLMCFLGDMGSPEGGHGLYDIEDDDMMAALIRTRASLLARAPGPQFAPAATSSA